MAKRKSQLPFAPKSKSKRAASTVTSISHRTNIRVDVGGPLGVEALTEDLLSKKHIQDSSDLRSGISFVEWLRSQDINLASHSIAYSGPMYRAVTAGYDPISVAGTLGAGGRYNVGFAQVTDGIEQLKDFNQVGGLYFGTSVETTQAEAGFGPWQLYRVRQENAASLWDISSLLPALDYPELTHHLSRYPISAQWRHQKVPLISQLLGNHLRSLGGDGIIFPSTKNPAGTVVFLFLNSDIESASRLKFEKFNAATPEQLQFESDKKK